MMAQSNEEEGEAEGMYNEEEGMCDEEEPEEEQAPHVFNMHPNGAGPADLVPFFQLQHSCFHIVLILLLMLSYHKIASW